MSSRKFHPTLSARRLSSSLAAWLLLALNAQAQDDSYKLHEKHIERVESAQKIGMLAVDVFGDQISHFSGALSFNNVDVSIPGNSALPVEVRRTFAIEDRREFTAGPSPKGHLGGFADWDLDVYHLSGIFNSTTGWQVAGSSPNARCTNANAPPSFPLFQPHDYWNGYNLNVPGGGAEELLKAQAGELPHPTAGGPYPWATRSNWRISCLPATKNGYPGEAFLAHSPDGTKVYLDHVIVKDAPSLKAGGAMAGEPVIGVMQRKSVYFMVSRIEDRFGNWVNYTYSGNQLQSIAASDGRQISLTYVSGRVSNVSSVLGTWTYAYTNNQLTSVTRPDGSKWLYSKSGKLRLSSVAVDPLDVWQGDCEVPEPSNSDLITYTVTHPAGAVGQFKLAANRQNRHYVPKYCVQLTSTDRHVLIPNVTDTFAVFEKKITGPGLPAMTWNYAYAGGTELAWAGLCANGGPICDQPRVVTITGPNGTYSREEYGIGYGINEGQLLRREVGSGPASLLETTTYAYGDQADANSQPYPWQAGTGLVMYADPMRTQIRPQKQVNFYRQGQNFTRSYTAFDAFARPTAVTRSSDLPLTYTSRSETTTYLDLLDSWVLGLVSQQIVAGVEVERTDFNVQGLPWKVYSHNQLVRTLAYNADGTTASVTDARNNTTSLGNWYRGVPQLVTFPDSTTLQATVDTRGWVSSVTNEVASTTSYHYDAMGRVSKVAYPAGDVVAWTPTDFVFSRSSTAAFGLPAGHWQRTVTRGNYRKTVYYDGLWRPVLEREWDQADVSATLRYNGRAYDHANRVTFEGYPRSAATSLSSFTSGVATSYDALGRVTRVEQDSELGDLVTTTEYQSGLKTLVTNPRGFGTLTAFRALDNPAEVKPYNIQAGGVTTSMWLDIFGKTTAMFRSGTYDGQAVSAARYYAYDTQQRLCKRTEPETGAAYFAYDADGNLAWSAEGQPTTNEFTCDRELVPSGERTTRSYDSRNRLTLVDHPDSTPDSSIAYTPDGKVATLSRSPTVLAYTYNKLGLLASEQLQFGAISWHVGHSYTALAHVGATTYPSGLQVNFAPNALGQATQAGTFATGARYFPSGALSQFTYGNGIVHTLAQNLRLLPERSRDALGSNVVLDDSYDYDANGNVAAISDGLPGQPGNRDMAYDALDRLITVAAGTAQGGNGAFSYDPLDNLRMLDQGGRQFRYVYDTANRLSEIRSPAGATLHTFDYDVRGNITGKDSGMLAFDRENRLIASALPTSTVYVYDGLGRRVAESSPAATYFYYTHEGSLLFTNDHKTQSNTEHIYLSGGLVANRTVPFAGGGAEVNYQHTDALGTPVAFSDAAGTVTRRERMTVWGEPADGTWTNGPGYTGHHVDAGSRLVYMQQRYYDPTIGRFISVDPIDVSSGDLRHFSRYTYAYNSPLRFVDPDGRHGGEARARADRQRQYEEAQRDDSRRDDFVKRLHERGGLGGAEPSYDADESSLGSWDPTTGEKLIGPRAFSYPNAEDVGSVIQHEGTHEAQSNQISDYVLLQNTNARTVLQDEAYRGELSESNPFRGGMSDVYRRDTEAKRAENRREANSANRALIDSGQSCRTSFCSGE